MKKYQWLIVLTLFCTVLLSCGEVLNEYYISNHTGESLTVTLTLTPFYFDQTDLSYGPLIENIRLSERENLQQPMDYEQIGESMQFILPPNTSIFLGFSTGGKKLFSQLEISSENRQVVMDRDDYREYFEIYDKFFGAIVQIYNVK
jgi:hypothetical protein